MPPLPLPSPFAAIQWFARSFPHRLAVDGLAEPVTYRRFANDIEKVTQQLVRQRIAPGGRIAVVVSRAYLHWLVTIALMRLGLASATVGPDQLDVLAPDVVVSDEGTEHPGAVAVRADQQWLAEEVQRFEEPPHAGEATARIVLSSGTTGVPKLAPFPFDQMYARTRATIIAYGLSTATRTLCLMGAGSIGGLVWVLATWEAGGCVILRGLQAGRPPWHVLHSTPTTLFVSTAQLDQLVRSLPPDFSPIPALTIYVAGSTVSKALNRRTRMRLSPSLMLVYGSTEVGTVTLAPAAHADQKPGLTGYVLPPARVEIVDENGNAVPEGTVGEVRVMTQGQAVDYLGDEAASRETFRDGWFHPGDLGTLSARGELSIKGRVRELMNFGGVKVSPDALDELLASFPGVLEVASFAAEARGKLQPFLAVVADKDLDETAIAARVRQAMPQLPPLKVLRVDAIPRNEMGKILRTELARRLSS